MLCENYSVKNEKKTEQPFDSIRMFFYYLLGTWILRQLMT